MPDIRDGLSAYVQGETVTVSDDGYIGIPVELTVYYDYASHGKVTPGYNGTPIILYVINTVTERIGTDSDVDIISSMLARGYAVVVADYLNDSKAVSPALEYSVQKIRTKLKSGTFFTDKTVFPTGTYYENHCVPAGYDISIGDVFYEIDKHGVDGALDKIVEVWNYDFRATYGSRIIKWVDENGERKSTQTGWNGSSPVWYSDASGNTVDNENGQYIKIDHTWAKKIQDCVKADGSPIDLSLHMDIIYPTSPEKDVPLMIASNSAQHSATFAAREDRPHFAGYSFNGYAVAMFDYEYIPMARDDHYGYFAGDTSQGKTGYNNAFALGAYNRGLYNTAAVRYLRYLSLTDHDTFAFDTDAFGLYGISKGGFQTFLGDAELQTSVTAADISADAGDAELREYLNTKICGYIREGIFCVIDPEERVTDAEGEAQNYLRFDGSTRYQNGKTATETFGDCVIDGGELQPWLTYTDENGTLREVTSGVQWIYSGCGGTTCTFGEGHCPIFTSINLNDNFGSGYSTQNYFPNLARIYDVPALYLECELEHEYVYGDDIRYGVDLYEALFKFSGYYLKGDAVSVVYTEPQDNSGRILTTDCVKVKFYGTVTGDEIEKVTVKDSGGNDVSGVWRSAYGGTEWSFYPDVTLKGGEKYTVTVPETLSGDNGKPMGEAYSFSFYTVDEDSTDLSVTGNTVISDTELRYLSVSVPSDLTLPYNALKLRFKVTNNSANTAEIYATDGDGGALGELLGSVALRGSGYYELDITDYLMTFGGERAWVCIKAKKTASDDVTYQNDMQTKGKLWISGDYAFTDEVETGDGVTAVGISLVPSDYYKYGFQVYAGWYPKILTVSNIINDGAAVTSADYGRTFTVTVRIYDTVSRPLQLWMNDCTDQSALTRDYDWQRTIVRTVAGEWMEISLDYTVYESDYGVAEQVKKFSIVAQSTGSTQLPVYVDSITVTEHITDIEISSAALVSVSRGDNAWTAPSSEDAPFSVDGVGYATLEKALTALKSATDKTVKLTASCTLGSYAAITDISDLTLDLNGHTVTLRDGSLLELSATNASDVSITVKNGNVLLAGSSPLISHTSSSSGDGKKYTVGFDGVYVGIADGCTARYIITCPDSASGAKISQDITFTDSVIDLGGGELPKTQVTLFSSVGSYLKSNCTLKGGRITAADVAQLTLRDDTASFTFEPNGDGEYTAVNIPASSSLSADEAYMSDKGYSYLARKSEKDGIATYIITSAKYSTKYGIIPDEYDPETYPFAVFTSGEFVGAYKWYSIGSDNTENAIYGARTVLVGENTKEAQIILRRDYDMTADGNKDTVYPNLGQLGGTLVIDLGKYTVTLKKNVSLVNMNGKMGYTSSLRKNHVYDSRIKVIGGEVITVAPAVNLYSSNPADPSTYDKVKEAYISFEGTTFRLPQQGSTSPIVGRWADVNTIYGMNAHIDFNGCEFDLSANTSSVTLFKADDAATKMNNALITVTGGSITASSLDKVTLSELDSGDSLVFAADKNGNRTTLTVPSSYTPPTFGVKSESGVYLTFTDGVEKGEVTVYTLGESSDVTSYGVIPSEYSAEEYPFAVFKDGEFIGAYKYWSLGGNTEGCALYAVQKLIRGVYSGEQVQILLRRDYTMSTSDVNFNNFGQIGGELIVDLGGYTLTQRSGVFLINMVGKYGWDNLQKKNHVYDTNITFKNGAIVTASALMYISSQSYSDESKAVLYDKTKVVDITFDGVSITLPQNASDRTLIKAGADANPDHGARFNVTFKDCAIDVSAISSDVTLFTEGKNEMNKLNVTLKGGYISAKDGGKLTFASLDSGDSLVFGKGEDGYTSLKLATGSAPSDEVTLTDGRCAVFGRHSTDGGYTVYELGEATKYGVIPFEFTAEEYPFAVFMNGELIGTYALWCQDNAVSALYAARLQLTSSTYTDREVQILLRRDYTIGSADNYYNNLAHFGGKLVVDLGSYTLTLNKPMFQARAQTGYDSVTKKITVWDSDITVVGGIIVTSGAAAVQCYTEVNAARVNDYSQAKRFAFTFEGTRFVLPASNAKAVITTTDKANHELGADFRITLKGCTVDATATSSAVTLFSVADANSLNRVSLTVSGGEILTGDAQKLTLARLGTDDSISFSEYSGRYTSFSCTKGEAPSDTYTSADGKSLVWKKLDGGGYILAEKLDKCGENVIWTLGEDGTLTVSGSGAMWDFQITEMPWYEYKDAIKKVIVEDGVTSIGKCAFYEFTAVSSVTLPNSLVRLGDYCFYGCSALEGVSIPEGVICIGSYAFRKSGITKAEIGGAWSTCTAEDLASSENAAKLLKKTYFKSVWIRLTSGEGSVIAEGECGKHLTWSLTDTGVLTVSGNGRMRDFSSNAAPWSAYADRIFKVNVEEGVTRIGRAAFYGCGYITEVTLPMSVTEIADFAFFDCRALRQITVFENVTKIGGYAFRKCPSLTAASFACADGWSNEGGDVASSTLADASAAAALLKSEYRSAWSRSELSE